MAIPYDAASFRTLTAPGLQEEFARNYQNALNQQGFPPGSVMMLRHSSAINDVNRIYSLDIAQGSPRPYAVFLTPEAVESLRRDGILRIIDPGGVAITLVVRGGEDRSGIEPGPKDELKARFSGLEFEPQGEK